MLIRMYNIGLTYYILFVRDGILLFNRRAALNENSFDPFCPRRKTTFYIYIYIILRVLYYNDSP